MRKISTEELDRRAAENNGFLTDVSTELGYRLLYNVIVDGNINFIKKLEQLRYIMLCRMDKDGDLVSYKSKQRMGRKTRKHFGINMLNQHETYWIGEEPKDENDKDKEW